ncbi:MAG: hypothetical protein M3319_08915, partial [Actinomycetota bacterium]|nr:hypothetical protein [Actinomycetota bacterium]
PDVDVLHLNALVAGERGVTMVVMTSGDTARCPACGHPSARRHSQRRRTIADLPYDSPELTRAGVSARPPMVVSLHQE